MMRKPNFSGINSSRGAYTVPTSLNKELLPATPVVWGEGAYSKTVDVPVGNLLPVMIWITNGTDQDLTVTFKHKVAANKYVEWRDGRGELVSFTALAGVDSVFGPIQAFPMYLGGQIVLSSPNTAETGPPPSKVTDSEIHVQEV